MLRLVIDPDPLVLLEQAAEAFLQPPGLKPEPEIPYLLVLRQGGLRDDLMALASERGVPGWFDPPLCVFHELPQLLGSTGRKPLDDFERPALLDYLLRTSGGATFRDRGRHYLLPLEQLFGELVSEGVTPDAYAGAIASLGPREQFEQNRDADVLNLYRGYVAELERLGRRDGRDSLADSAAALRASTGELVRRLDGRREIRIVGLSDLRGGWRTLLAALCGSPAIDTVVIYSTDPLQLPAALLLHLEKNRPEPPAPDSLLAGLRPPHRGYVLLPQPDNDRQLEAVSSRIRELIDSGVAPHRIAVVSRDARPWVDLAVRSLADAGVPALARRRVALREIPVVRALLVLLRAAAEGWTRHGLAEIGSQPFFERLVDGRIVNFIGYRRRVAGLAAWTNALSQLLEEARAAEAEPAADGVRRVRTLPSSWVIQAVERFATFSGIAAELDTSRPLLGWLAWLAGWLERDPLKMQRRMARVPHDRWDVVRLDLLAWRGLGAALDGWLEALRQWPEPEDPLTVEEFTRRLEVELTADVALWTDGHRGVRVAEALAASYRCFDHVFLVGMNAGSFPRRAPSSLVLGPEDRELLAAAGLPVDTSTAWDARERSLFRTLLGGARGSLTLSYLSLDETGADAIPSAFVEAIRPAATPDQGDWRPLPLLRTADGAGHAFRAATIERLRGTGRLSPWNGAIESPALLGWLAARYGDSHVWGPSHIEEYAKCPWAWFSNRLLRLERREDPDADIDARVRGAVLHSALRRFYDAAGRRQGEPVQLRPADREWVLPLLFEALEQALGEAGGTVWLGHPALRDQKHAELRATLQAFLEFELEQNEKALDGRTTSGKMVRTAVLAHEVDLAETVLERNGVRFRFQGRVDRMEVGRDPRAPGSWLAAVDYKTSTYSCPGGGRAEAWNDGVVLQLPLYAHALQVRNPEAAIAWVEYRAITQARRVHSLPLVTVGRRSATEDSDAQGRLEGALDAAALQVRRIRSGEFPAAPAPSCLCPPFCHGWDICRVAGGPRGVRD